MGFLVLRKGTQVFSGREMHLAVPASESDFTILPLKHPILPSQRMQIFHIGSGRVSCLNMDSNEMTESCLGQTSFQEQ